MGAHEAADAVLTQLEADRLRARALEVVAELDDIIEDTDGGSERIWRWAGQASYILAEVARG